MALSPSSTTTRRPARTDAHSQTQQGQTDLEFSGLDLDAVRGVKQHRAWHAMKAQIEKELGRSVPGLTWPQALMLLGVAAKAGRGETPSQADIVALTLIDRSTMAELVRRMVRKGFVARVRSRVDARRWQLRLTPAGVKAAHDVTATLS